MSAPSASTSRPRQGSERLSARHPQPGPSSPRPARPAASKPPAARPICETQPTTVKLSSSSLRNLAYRLRHPPAIPPELAACEAAKAYARADAKGKGKAHWWSLDLANWGIRIQPHYEVSLEDVLDRKHLPPLGLKDFEEWLLFVDGTPENLYFILWLREYTARYEAWMASLQTLKRSPSASSTRTRDHGLAFSRNPSASMHRVPASSERPYASLGLAMSSLHLPPAGTRSQPASPVTGRASHAPFRNAISMNPLQTVQDELEIDDPPRRVYTTSPPPLPQPDRSLVLFYLRAKETFLAPNAPYELDVGSEVLNGFFVSGERKARREEVDRSPYAALRNLSSHNLSSYPTGFGGKMPPDPAVFAELKGIVEERLKASLSRLVIATYNNVGMSRAYCGNAGGVVIGIVTSAPPLAASFSLGASRWFRILALPGMWLGLTIFISALYGVCMMIYIFGDLRQLRSFELSRPGISQPKPAPPLKDGQAGSINAHSPTAIKFNNPWDPGDAGAGALPGPSPVGWDPRKMSLPAAGGAAEKAMPRKLSLPAVLSGLVANRSREKVVAPVDEETRWRANLQAATTPLTRPPVLSIRPPSAASHVPASPRSASSVRSERVRPPALTIVPPDAVYVRPGRESVKGRRVRRRAEGTAESGPSVSGDHEQPDAAEVDDHENHGDDEDYSSDSSYGSSESSASEDETHEAVDPKDTRPAPRRRRRRRRQRLVIEVSDRLYDEHPSPEGPATAPADFLPGAYERALRAQAARDTPPPAPSSAAHGKRRASVITTGSAAPHPNPLWPDYEGSTEGHPASYGCGYSDDAAHDEPDGPRTAAFIRPFAYPADGHEHAITDDVLAAARRAPDVEHGPRLPAPAAVPQLQEVHEFDFDGLPPPPAPAAAPKTAAKANANTAGSAGACSQVHLPLCPPARVHPRPPSPAPSASTRSDLGSAIDRRGRCWLVRAFWGALERMQRRCSPENVVQVLRRRSAESLAGDGAGGEKAEACEAHAAQQQQQRAEGAGAQEGSARREREFVKRRRRRAREGVAGEGWRVRVRSFYLSAPAFAAPLTPVLNPLVGRAQWEIVVRSAALAFVLACVVVAGLVGVPE